MSITVLKAGTQTTVQDLGRPGFAHLGISASGAADAFSFRIGNQLVGNDPNTTALEITLTGGEYEFGSNAVIAITGSTFDASIDGQPISNWKGYNIQKGQCLQINSSRDGARCYVCVQGGFDIPLLLACRSTHLMTGLGGFEGRTLRKGDVLELAHASESQCANMNNVEGILKQLNRNTIRVTKGLEGDWFTDDAWDSFLNNQFSVSQTFSRMGIRMEGNSIESSAGHEIVTQGVPLGAVQVPGNGQPIISFVEHQTTGGYPRIANVISADLCKVGQLKPGDRFQFALVSMAEAEQLYAEQMNIIHNLSAL